MKIAVNTRLLLDGRLEGIGWFTYESLKRIVRHHPEHEFFFIFDRPYAKKFVLGPNVTPIVTFPPARHPYLWYLYFEYSIPRILKKIGTDLFFSPDGWLSLKTPVKQIDVIHDLNFEHQSDFLVSKHQEYLKKYFPQFARQAVRLATVSEFSKQDIHSLYQIPEDKIEVVYNGCNADFVPLSAERKQKVKAAFSQGCDYFLFVSAIHKRKNLANILRAYDAFKEEKPSNTKFLVVGNRAGAQGDIDEVLNNMKHKDDVLFLGHLPSKELSWVTGAATALVYASFFEGFGIPILEAFYAETPVITSNVTSMPEIAGDAALLVDPNEVGQIKEAMTSLASSPQLCETLIAKGREQRQNFSWDLTAQKLWNCIEKEL